MAHLVCPGSFSGTQRLLHSGHSIPCYPHTSLLHSRACKIVLLWYTLTPEGEQTSQEEANDDVSEMLGSVVGSVMSSGSGFLRASNIVFLSTPVLLGIQNIMNIDETMYNEGYDTDGNIGSFYDSVEHQEDLTPNIEEKALLSQEELEALMAWAENLVNNDTTCQVRDDVTAGDADTFVLISDKDTGEMR
eukprot:6356352-Ditylum_brightwellii.AAC.1